MQHRPHVVIREYGCTRCQKWHRQNIDPEYQDHMMWQSKHGWRERPASTADLFALALKSQEAGVRDDAGPLPFCEN